jgi:hypothetical protein
MKNKDKDKDGLIETLIDGFSAKNKDYYCSNPFAYYFSGVEYESDYEYPCQNGSDCCDNDYCRCGIVTNANVKSVDIDALISNLFTKSKDTNVISQYCVDRLIRNSDLKDTASWEVSVSGGYYGQETNGCVPNQKIIDSLVKDFTEILNKKDYSKIKHCLKSEYGFLLSDLVNMKKLELKEVKTFDVELLNNNYSRKINRKFVDQYNNFILPRAVCVKIGKKFKVIDGYHRMLSAINQKLEKVSILVMS